MIRVICTNPSLAFHGDFGTVVGGEFGADVRPGNVVDVVWLDYQDEGPDEIDGGNLRIIDEAVFVVECAERGLDRGVWPVDV